MIKPGAYLDLGRIESRAEGTPPLIQRVFPRLTDFFGPPYARFILRTWPIRLMGTEHLLEMADRLQTGNPCLIAFRHPGDSDPHLVYLALSKYLNQLLRSQGKKDSTRGKPRNRISTRFLAGADLIMWGDPMVEWALCCSGCVPVRHGGGEASLMNRTLKMVLEEGSALVLAPEGQIMYHCQAEFNLDPGIAWMALRLQDMAGPDLRVGMYPLHVQYRHPKETWQRLDRFVRQLEVLVFGHDACRDRIKGEGSARFALNPKNFPPLKPYAGESPAAGVAENIRQRLMELWDELIRKGEALYGLSVDVPLGTELKKRGLDVAEAAMARVERACNRREGQDLKARIMNIRALLMDRVLAKPEWTELEAGIARCGMEEAFWLQRHVERADLLEYLDPSYIYGSEDFLQSPDGFTRLIEIAQNLWDLAGRLAGGSVGWRSKFFRSEVVVAAGPVQELQAGEVNGEAGLKVPRRQRMDDTMSRLQDGFRELREAHKP